MSTRSTITKHKHLPCMVSRVTIRAKREDTLIPGAINLKNLQMGIGPELTYALLIIHEHRITKTVSTTVLKEDLLIFGVIREQLHGIIVHQKVF